MIIWQQPNEIWTVHLIFLPSHFYYTTPHWPFGNGLTGVVEHSLIVCPDTTKGIWHKTKYNGSFVDRHSQIPKTYKLFFHSEHIHSAAMFSTWDYISDIKTWISLSPWETHHWTRRNTVTYKMMLAVQYGSPNWMLILYN